MLAIPSSCRRGRLHPGCPAQVSVRTTEQEPCQPSRTRGSASRLRQPRGARHHGSGDAGGFCHAPLRPCRAT